ncbi:26S proteasome regulatory particle non-ATPase subunit 12 [Tripterygium wilfordii]|uniref:26S proteasome regulatory particle non-ATPase subunit 12 n=1 Tax=Tripterygium wilfordii TaxID=458696 RepID=A0A7J7CLU1_TRIWF|nr:26S proteasome regulatory particle non-ATPase subunit 12 [Tripterygium wilfordii]
MNPKLTEASQLFERFKSALVRNDFDTCANLLSQLKVLLTRFRSLPPLFEDTPNAIHELTLARDIYEHAVILSMKTEDQDAFERDFFQLKPYYTDASGCLPSSPQEYILLGLNLLRLLVQNRIAEFHTELELLSSTALDNPCIKHAVELEQSFMEGAYNCVLSARQTAPHESFVYFMDLLAKTVRVTAAPPVFKEDTTVNADANLFEVHFDEITSRVGDEHVPVKIHRHVIRCRENGDAVIVSRDAIATAEVVDCKGIERRYCIYRANDEEAAVSFGVNGEA